MDCGREVEGTEAHKRIEPARRLRAGSQSDGSIASYTCRRGWTIALQVREVNSEAARREAREKLIKAARYLGLDP